MTSMELFGPNDLFKFNNINLDPLTATYNLDFYLGYFSKWPDYNYLLRAVDGSPIGYVMGKAETARHLSEEVARSPAVKKWHGHVTAVTVAPEHRRMGLGVALMHILEDVTEKIYKGYFVDLYVRASNPAVQWYEKQGYSTYRTVLEYYQDYGRANEDALDMRKAFVSLDPKKETEVPLKQNGGKVSWSELDSTL
eukprot:TRINITY_DN13518_c0_g1_i1.p1 TRINITY_DN13518_c0_g1~~TRINITY_DN13518_c0_g1_i1.p1  ORF type:complete len:195 (-),score=35.99 TRINITY_DN13518_c0_g1_i1:45-629(-)